MSKDDIPPSCGIIIRTRGFGQFSMHPFTHFEGNITDAEVSHYTSLIEGIAYLLAESPEMFVSLGDLVLENAELSGVSVEFEPDEELLEAIHDSTIIPFKKKH